jgi:UDP-glucose:(heptosyl)LPS alpha-1,3-glucosyltransferase
VNALIIAQDFERKGLAQTIDALALVNDKRLRLTVVGKEAADRYHNQSADRGVADQITFAGATTDTRAFYHNADFFVLPTKHDPCSLVVLEALACGLPVISTRFNGACETMTEGVHGFVLDDPNDINALADRMRRLLDPALRARMSQACITLRPQLAYEHHLATLLDIYAHAIAIRGHRE